MTARFRLLSVILTLTLAATACVTDDNEAIGPSSTGPDGIDLSSENVILTSTRLQTEDSCDGLLQRLIAEGVKQVGPFGFGGQGGPIFFEGDVAMMEAASDSASNVGGAPGTTVAAARDTGADGSFSGTNNQEVDVDEADLVKTDGQRLVVINGNTLRVVDLTGENPRLDRTIQLGEDTWATEMFLVGDRALLLTQGWTNVPFIDDVARFPVPPEGSPTSKIIEVNITTGEIGQTIEFEGSYLSAREVSGSIRVVLSAGIGRFPFLFPSNQSAEKAAEEANRRLIQESTIEQWLPTYRITDDGAVIAEGPAVDCNRIHLPSEFSGFGSLTVLTVNLDNGLELLDSLGVVTDGQTVYASTDRLTVATARWPEWDRETGSIRAEENYSTALHSFDISDLGRTEYVGSGEVVGHLLSQYSLSEQDGFLRVATTVGDPWTGSDQTSESFVSIFDEVDGALQQVGQVGGLGKGEQIFSVRFLGNTAYVVTFRQTDPLYTVDLSSPTDPSVLGELKIPGVSNYLHPISDGVLLGVGQDGDETGRTTGAQVSLFNVADLSNPTRVDQLTLGENSYSTVDWDAKSFLYWPAEKLAVVPVSWWAYDEETQTDAGSNAAVLLRVDDGTLTEIGRVSHPRITQCDRGIVYDDAPTPADTESSDAEANLVVEPTTTVPASDPPISEEYCWTHQPEVRRTVIVGETIYTVSDAGVKANSLVDLSDRGWLPFEG